ncbi:single-stranded DNA-binding protein [bacterium]|nr:single-stranded DNA-binding protein [bacterium]
MQKGSLNRVILIGHVGRDPETRYMPSGAAICNFSIATTESWNEQDGNQQSHTEWHRCDAFGKSAEIIAQWVKKGQLLMVEGSIRSREYTDKEGVARKAFSIRMENFTMLGKKSGSQESGEQPFKSEPKKDSEEAKDDEVPF